MIQSEFLPLLEEVLKICKERFSDRLAAIYLHGSIAQGDAVIGISDLDLMIILTRRNGKHDDAWLDAVVHGLQKKHSRLIDGAHISLLDENELVENRFARFALNSG